MMKSCINKYKLLFVFGVVFLCMHAPMKAMRTTDSASEEFQDLADLTPEQEALETINRIMHTLDRDYRRLHAQIDLGYQPIITQTTMRAIDTQLTNLRDAFQVLLHIFPAPGPSRTFNTRCAQLAALINRILMHLERAHQTIASEPPTSQQEYARARELKHALSSSLRATTVEHDVTHECERDVVHVATSVERLQHIAPRKLHGFCAGLAALAQSAVQFVHEQKQEQLHRASSAELLEQLGPGAEEQEQTRALFDELPGPRDHTPVTPALDHLAQRAQQLQPYVDSDTDTIQHLLQHARTAAISAVQRVYGATDRSLSAAAAFLEKNKGRDLTTPAVQRGTAFIIAPPSGTTLAFRVTQRIPECLLRFIMPAGIIRMLKSRGIQPSDFTLLHPKLCHLLGITPAHQVWAKEHIPAVLQAATNFLKPECVQTTQERIRHVQAALPNIADTATHALKTIRTSITPEQIRRVQQTIADGIHTVQRLNRFNQEIRTQEEHQAAALRELGQYDQRVQRIQQEEEAAHVLAQQLQIQRSVQEATGSALPLRPAQAILLGARTTGESPELGTKTRLESSFLRHVHSQDAL